MKFISTILFLAALIIMTSCKDSTLSPEPTAAKMYLVKFNPGTGANSKSPDYYSIIEYNLSTKKYSVVVDKAILCSNVLNGEFLYWQSDNKVYSYNISSKQSTQLPNFTMETMSWFLQTNDGKLIYTEKYSTDNDMSYMRIYLGTKSNIKNVLICENMKDESTADICTSSGSLVYSVGEGYPNDSLFVADLNTGMKSFLKDSISIYSDNQKSYSCSSKQGIVAAISLELEQYKNNAQLVTIDLSTKKMRYLTNSLLPKGFPAFNPAGTKIFFVEIDKDNSRYNFNLINTDGTNKTEIFQTDLIKNFDIYSVKWIDDSHIAYSLLSSTADFTTESYVFDINTKENQLIEIGTLMLPI